jgi:hypothetical protein
VKLAPHMILSLSHDGTRVVIREKQLAEGGTWDGSRVEDALAAAASDKVPA